METEAECGKSTDLILSVERDDTGFMRPYDCLASFDNIWIRLPLKFIRNEEQEEASLQEVDSEKERHEAQIGVVLEDLVERFGG